MSFCHYVSRCLNILDHYQQLVKGCYINLINENACKFTWLRIFNY